MANVTTNTMTNYTTSTTSAVIIAPMRDDFVLDGAEKFFKEGQMNELVEFCKWDNANTVWLEEGIRDICFSASYDEPLCAPEYAKAMKVGIEAVEDTQKNAGLDLVTSIGKRPVGISAIRSICSRGMIGLNCYDLLRTNNRGSLKTVLNLIFAERTGTVRVKYSHEKIRAVHSGRYANISNEELLMIMRGYLDQNWPDYEFESAYMSHESMQVVIDLGAYKQQFFRKMPPEFARNYTPAIVMISSDVAESAVRLIPCLNMGNGVVTRMSKDIAIPHLGEDIRARVENAFTALLAYFDEASADIEKMNSIVIHNGVAALARMLTKGGMPKEEGREALAAFSAIHKGYTVTATEIYLAVCDAYAAVVRNHAQDAKKIFAAAECVARTAAWNLWSSVDAPGKEDI